MKMIKYCAMGLVLASGALCFEEVFAAPTQNGFISLSESENSGDSCGFDAITGSYEMSSTSNCKNDTYSYFRLDNVPSATKIVFYSEGDCKKRPDWSFTVLTYKHPTTTKMLAIPDLNNREEGTIVAAGVLLKKKYYDHGNIPGKLSCVIVCRSDTNCSLPNW